MTEEHKQRVKRELIEAGVTKYSLKKNETRHLPQIIHEDEHIAAAINGRAAAGAVMMVATDRRILFLDCKSFYSSIDEITYDVLSGVLHHIQGLFSNVVVHTRVGEYNLRFVNNKQAKRFVAYLEAKKLEASEQTDAKNYNPIEAVTPRPAKYNFESKEKEFLQTHAVGVLSTIDRTGNVHGAAVYYLCDSDNNLYILTKSETLKARNMLIHKQVALTIFEEYTLSSLQISGIADVVTDQVSANQVFSQIMQERQYDEGKSLPPVSKILEGGFVVFCITVTTAEYRNFKK